MSFLCGSVINVWLAVFIMTYQLCGQYDVMTATNILSDYDVCMASA